MSWFSRSSDKPRLDWKTLTTEAEFLQLLTFEEVAIFKHSTRCSISSMARNRLERDLAGKAHIPVYYLDLIAYRNVSDLIAERLGVPHQSPQLIVLQRGEVLAHSSHNAISGALLERSAA